MARLITTEKFGLYHLTSAGACSWHEFALAIFEEAGLRPEVVPVTSNHFPAKARRPQYSVLENRRFRDEGFEDLRPWREALRDYIRGRRW